MKFALFVLATVATAQTLAPVDPALAEIAATHGFLQTAISPDGAHVAYVEALDAPGQSSTYVAPRTNVTAGDGKSAYDEASIAWSPDSKQLSFLSDHEKKELLQLYVAPADGGPARLLTHLKGLLAEPRRSPDGKSIVFIGGLMSDEGSTGGDVYQPELTYSGTLANAPPLSVVNQ